VVLEKQEQYALLNGLLRRFVAVGFFIAGPAGQNRHPAPWNYNPEKGAGYDNSGVPDETILGCRIKRS
jgi:hypothetical protein